MDGGGGKDREQLMEAQRVENHSTCHLGGGGKFASIELDIAKRERERKQKERECTYDEILPLQ